MNMDYDTFTCFMTIKKYIPNKKGFDETISDISPSSLRLLGKLILFPKEFKSVFFCDYNEAIDFLDGNGFKVEGNNTDGYTVSLLNN